MRLKIKVRALLKGLGAMKGKKASLKERLDKLEVDKNERRRLFDDLCRHIESGLSLQSFGKVHYQTIQRYFDRFPDEFPKDEYELAEAKGRANWEGIGYRQAAGQCMGNSRSWYYNMANRFGWRDKLDIEAEHKGQVAVNIVNYGSSKPSQDSLSK